MRAAKGVPRPGVPSGGGPSVELPGVGASDRLRVVGSRDTDAETRLRRRRLPAQ